MAFEDIDRPLLGKPRMRRGERIRYVPNHRSFGAFMKSEQMRDVTDEAAQDIARIATTTQPPRSSTDRSRSKKALATYKVRRRAGLAKIAGNLRVRVVVEGRGRGVERAEFGYQNGDQRYRTLAQAGIAVGGDLKHSESVR